VTFLLKPGWVILALVVVAFAYLCFNVLAPWQLGKHVRTSHRNNLIAASVHADPVPIEKLLGTGSAGAPADDEWRRVDLTGDYLPDSTVLVRLRSVDDSPAFEVLTAFRLTDGRAVLVDRGYVSPIGADAIRPPAVWATEPPAGRVTVAARIRRSEGVIPSRPPIAEDGYRQVYSIDAGQVAALTGVPLVAGYVQTESGQPGAFRPVELPQLDAGPYLSYGLQWLAFGLMAPLGLGYFVRSEIRQRREERQTSGAASPDNRPDPVEREPATVAAAAEPVGAARAPLRRKPMSEPPPLTPNEARLADRYGRHR
jgi:cytochrome oxidase assembly protein ShyY1